ncbi:MAG: Holliday junction resolvase RuvX [Eubacteriales bacterium]|nr:Holliday junction resolvase RuvX [Eubacteriales bacterium]
MARVIGLDVGDVRIGVAVSDPLQMIAQSVGYIKRIGYSKDIAQIKEYALQYETKTLVLGLPKLLSGIEGEQAQKTRAFGAELEKHGFEIIYQDERLSSKTAESVLIAGNMQRKDRKQHVDKIAAAIILQVWLDKK